MALSRGALVGPYEIISPIGAGGMGEVYRARDTSLNRDVALKVLPDSLAGDADRLARFQREAEALAALNHPNIAAIYGIQETTPEVGRGSDSAGPTSEVVSRALVMELVEGTDLSAVIAHGAMALADAVPIARQIAEALEAAHERGIIHRDLKPANIKVRDDGTVKVLDFGLAKAFDPAPDAASGPGEATIANSPTMMSPAMTQAGVILGTAAYMAPEQAKGRVVDKRADVWAFGVVFYEMLTGRSLFQGETLVETLAQVMTHEPPLDALPATVPPAIRQLLARCLQRDPKLRLRDIGEARILLDSPDALGPPAASENTSRPSFWRPIHFVAITGALALGLVADAVLFTPAPSMADAVTRFPVELAPGTRLGPAPPPSNLRPNSRSFAVSPDGRYLVYAGQEDTGTGVQLYLRRMDQDQSTLLTNGAFPIFSPDSADVAFLQPGDGGLRLMRMPIAGGPARSILEPRPEFPVQLQSWSDDDEILFASRGGVFAVSADGGEPRQLTTSEAGSSHRFPQMLPGGKAVLFNVVRGEVPSRWEVVVEDVDSHERRVVVAGGSYPTYAASGHVLFVRTGKLWAVAFDPTTLTTGGDPVVVLEDVMLTERGSSSAFRTGYGQYSVSQTGTLAFAPGGVYTVASNSIGWMTRDGTFTEIPGSPGNIQYPALSPDSRRLAWVSGLDDRAIWMVDFRDGLPRKLTADTGYRSAPVWSPDGARLVYQFADGDQSWLELLTVDSSGASERIELDVPLTPASWSSSNVLALIGSGRVWTMPMDGSNAPRTFIESSAQIRYPTFSPDGKWLAYSSNETGEDKVYVRPYPGEGRASVPVSPDDTNSPVWSRDGKELFFALRSTRQLFSVGVTTTDGFHTNGAPRPSIRLNGLTGPLRSYDVAVDGRFVVLGQSESIPDQPVTRIHLVLNWFEELTRMATRR